MLASLDFESFLGKRLMNPRSKKLSIGVSTGPSVPATSLTTVRRSGTCFISRHTLALDIRCFLATCVKDIPDV